MAVRLNTRSMVVLGPPVLLTPRVAYGWTGSAVAVSRNGTLVYRAPDGCRTRASNSWTPAASFASSLDASVSTARRAFHPTVAALSLPSGLRVSWGDAWVSRARTCGCLM